MRDALKVKCLPILLVFVVFHFMVSIVSICLVDYVGLGGNSDILRHRKPRDVRIAGDPEFRHRDVGTC